MHFLCSEVVDIAIDGSSPKSSLSPHIQLEFGNSYISFVCKVFFAEQFESLRQLIYTPGEERYSACLLTKFCLPIHYLPFDLLTSLGSCPITRGCFKLIM